MGVLLYRRRVMGEVLPYDAKIEYLQSSGTQYINTGVTQTTTSWVLSAQVTSAKPSNKALIGSKDVGGQFFGDIYKPGNKWGVGGSSGNYVSVSSTTKADIEVNFNSSGMVSGVVNGETFSRNGVSPDGPTYLFCCFSNQGANYHIYAKLFFAKCYIGGDLILDMIPVRVGQVGYMYDKVSKQLFGNAGTGNFVLGPDI